MCLWAIYIFPGSVHIFPPAEKADPSWEYIIRSQTYECGNYDWGPDIPFLGIFVSNFRHFVFAVHSSRFKLKAMLCRGFWDGVEPVSLPLPLPRHHQGREQLLKNHSKKKNSCKLFKNKRSTFIFSILHRCMRAVGGVLKINKKILEQ